MIYLYAINIKNENFTDKIETLLTEISEERANRAKKSRVITMSSGWTSAILIADLIKRGSGSDTVFEDEHSGRDCRT